MIVDTRELALIEHLKKIGTEFQTRQLDLADIIFEGKKGILMAIERKTIKDLEQSNKDGRYREQRARLIDNYVKNGIKVLYLIEGYKIDNGIFMSMFVNLIIRDNIGVYHTPDVQESTRFLVKLKEKFGEHPEENLFGKGIVGYLGTVKLQKKENLDPKSIYILQLAQIPGMSVKMSEAVQEVCPNMPDLCKWCEGQGENVIADIKVGSRKIGKVVSKRVHDSILGKK